MSDFNQGVIAEFRANAGKVGGYFADRDMVLLTTTGAKTGKQTTIPLVYLNDPESGRMFIIASKGGAPTHPAWYHNLLANPQATIEVGPERYTVRATDTAGAERDRLFAYTVEQMPGFGDYQRNTTRIIPVLYLDPIG